MLALERQISDNMSMKFLTEEKNANTLMYSFIDNNNVEQFIGLRANNSEDNLHRGLHLLNDLIDYHYGRDFRASIRVEYINRFGRTQAYYGNYNRFETLEQLPLGEIQ